MSNEREDLGTNSHTLGGIQQALAQFTAVPPQLDRDRLMFLAGQASLLSPAAHGRHRRVEAAAKQRIAWIWPASTATLAASTLALLLTLASRQQPKVVYIDRPVTTRGPQAAAEPRAVALEVATLQGNRPGAPITLPVPRNNYIRAREVALRMGVDALGSQSYGSSAVPTATYGTLLEGLVPRQKDSSSLDSFLGM